MATLYGSGKGLVRLVAGLQLIIGILLFIFGSVCAALICHWASKAGLAIWIGVIVIITAAIGLYSSLVRGQVMISWFSGLSIFCAFLSLVLCISYGTAMADFYDEFTSNTSPVDEFYSRQYVAVYMRTSYYESCLSAKRKAEIERERTGHIDVIHIETDEESKLLSEMKYHGRKGIALAAVIICLAALEFVFACACVMYSCTAAGWFVKTSSNVPVKSNVTIHHSQASGLVLR